MHTTNPLPHDDELTDRILCPYANEHGGLGVSVWLHSRSTPVVGLPVAYRAAHLEVTECGHENHSQLVISATPTELRRFLVDALAALDTAITAGADTAADDTAAASGNRSSAAETATGETTIESGDTAP